MVSFFGALCCVAVAQALTTTTTTTTPPRSSGKRPGLANLPSKILVQKLKTARGVAEVSELLEESPDVLDGFVASAAMSQFRKFGKPYAALAIFREWKERGVFDRVEPYNAAIAAAERVRDWKKARKFFNELKESGLEPTIITYNAMISA